MAGSFIRWETHTGQPETIAGWQILPISRALVINPQRVQGGLVWNRPNAIAVTGEDGVQHIVAVQNETRRRLLFWLAVGLAGSLFVRTLFGLLRSE